MKVKYKLYGSAAVFIVLMSILVAGRFLSFGIVEEENRSHRIAEDVTDGAFDLAILTHEYLSLRDELSEDAWNAKFNSVANTLVEGAKKETAPMRSDLISVGDVFLLVTRNYKRTLTLREQGALQEEIDSTILNETELVDQLLTKIRSITDVSSTLSDIASTNAKDSLTFFNRLDIALLAGVAIMLASASVILARGISNPLDQLTRATEIIGDGNLEYRTGIDSGDEFGTLSQAFDRMMERLSVTTVSRDALLVEVETRRVVEQQRSALLVEIEEKNAELERFAYTVSHDLKSPLITVKGFLGALKEDSTKGNFDRMQHDMDRISNAADTMTELLDGLLDLARIGQVLGRQEEILIGEVAGEAVDLVVGLRERGEVKIHVTADFPAVFGDRLRIREIFQNLIENAFKFMGDEPSPLVEIGARHENGEVLCFVKDNGIGIESRFHQRVFGLFDKLEQGNDGTGLGLALVKRIAEAHGGRVWVESEGLGLGSTFYFTMPLKGG